MSEHRIVPGPEVARRLGAVLAFAAALVSTASAYITAEQLATVRRPAIYAFDTPWTAQEQRSYSRLARGTKLTALAVTVGAASVTRVIHPAASLAGATFLVWRAFTDQSPGPDATWTDFWADVAAVVCSLLLVVAVRRSRGPSASQRRRLPTLPAST